MEYQTNLFGGLVFWLYIVAALAFTGLVVNTILNLKPTDYAARNRNHVTTFSILALLSFTSLSFNMLHVLISSYQLWSIHHFPATPIMPTVSLENIWTWSITSTLFQDFGEAIVQDEARYFWTQSALLATFSLCLYMGAEGLRCGIPRLWAFFALSQILPISFAQNLFYVARLQSSPVAPTVQLPRNRTVRLIAAYCACLAVAPYASEGPYLIPTILAARLLLVLPLLLPSLQHIERTDSELSRTPGRPFDQRVTQKTMAVFAAALTVKQVYQVYQQGVSLPELVRTLFEHPAVTSLGFDMVISGLSYAIWTSWADPTRRSGKKSGKAS